MASADTPSPFAFRFGKRASLTILTGIGTVLASIILLDVYQDWIPEGKPLWSTLAENAIPLLLALSIPVLGWRLARTERGREYLSEAVRWTLLGSLATLLIAGLALGFQLIQQEIKPIVFLTQITTAGAFVGLLVGYALAYKEQAPLGTGRQRSKERARHSSVLGRRGALAILAGIGGVLAATILFDVYQDWVLEGKPLWSTIVENIVPFLFASALPLAGWRVAQAGAAHVVSAARWALVGCIGTLVVSGLVVGLQLLQGELKPPVIVTQLTTVGAATGLLVGYGFSRLRQVRGALSARERRLDAVFNHTFQFTGLMEPDGTLIEANDTVLRFGGVEEEDVLGKPLWELPWAQAGPETKRTIREAVRRARGGEFVRDEIEIQGAEETRIIDFSVRPVTDEEGEVSLLIPEGRDITERKKREEELRRAKEQAEEAARVKTSMLANMNHELRTPLTPIKGFSEALEEELSGYPAELAGRIQKSSRRLLSTLDAVLQLSELEAGSYELERERVALQEVADDAVDLFEAEAEDEGVEMEVKTGRSVVGRWNEGALRRIAENLLENAIKFTPEGGKVVVRVDKTDQAGVLEVEDTGVGIEEEAVPTVFESFRQESEGLDREYEGTGLGLSITDRLVDALDGSIEVETEKGEGTCFTVRLPGGNEGDSGEEGR